MPDKAAALTQIFFQLGSVVAAPLGGGLYDAIGWRGTCIIVACLSFSAAAVYTVQICFFSGAKSSR